MLSELIIKQAMKTPYHKGHLYHADGSLYMGRYSLFETDRLSARVHHIATPDDDRVMHDHPWNFTSYVLRGGYLEFRPLLYGAIWHDGQELGYTSYRGAGSWAYRKSSDRHRISMVTPDTWTLFVYGKFQNDWGFYTEEGKVQWRTYLDSGNSTMSKENNSVKS